MSEIEVRAHLRAIYDKRYQDGDSEWRRLGAAGKAANIVSLCNELPHSSILEIGAGDGSILQRLAERSFGASLHALEISPSGVDTIQRKRIPGLVECKLFDGYQIPYENDKFDLAILSHVIEHVEYPRKLLYEAARVAKHVYVEVPLEDNSRMNDDFVHDKVGHINFYSPRTIRFLLQSSNLTVLSQMTTISSRGVYVFQYGFKGVLYYHIKAIALKAIPPLATKLFTYNGSLVCRRSVS
jgi:SAM-dependent methyltransferase